MNPVATSDAAFRGGACPTPEYTIAYTGNYTTSADANSAKRQAAIRARNEASSRRSDLREAAAKIYDQDHLEVFLGASHPRLGKSPLDHCVDQRTLQECLALLPRSRRARLR
jgi:hypothetical protein